MADPKILIIKLSAIGDCLHATPVIESLRRAYPNGQIDWLVHPHSAPMVEGNPYLSSVKIWPRKDLVNTFLSVAKELRREKYDIVLDLQGLLKSGLMTLATGASRRIGPSEAREGATHCYNQKVKRGIPEVHVVQGYLELARAAGGVVEPEPQMFVPLSEDDRKAADAISPEGRFAILNPSAGKAIKQWPVEHFAALADHLVESGSVRVVLTGAPVDKVLTTRIVEIAKSKDLIDLAGKTSLKSLAALIAKADLFVGGDTGPMHIAQAVGTPTLALFGPTDANHLGPRELPHKAVTLNVECSPCRHRVCPIGHICLQDLTPLRVAAEATRMLAEKASAASR